MKDRNLLKAVGLWVVLLAFGQVAAGAPFNSAGFTRKMPIQTAGYTKTGTLTNFPLLVQFAEGSNAFHYADLASPTNGADLRFTDSTLTNELNYEIDQWSTTAVSCVWVQVPQLADNNTSIYAWYGNAAATAPAYTTNGATWVNAYVGVWHFGDTNSAGKLPDSTTNVNVGTISGVTTTTGQVGSGRLFNGSSFVSIGDKLDSTFAGANKQFTMDCWVKPNSNMVVGGFALFGKICGISGGAASDGRECILRVYNGGFLDFLWYGSLDGTSGHRSYTNQTAAITDTSKWYHVVAEYDATQGITARGTFFVNGRQENGVVYLSSATPANIVDGPASLGLGAGLDPTGTKSNYCFPGVLDEMRISQGLRASNWVWACWANQASNRVFNLYSDVQSITGPVPPQIENRPATNVLSTSAFFNGYLSATGSSPVTLSVLWGESDQGTGSTWSKTNAFAEGQWQAGQYPTTNITTLAQNKNYYYTYFGQGALTSAWATLGSQYLITGDVTVQATDPVGRATPSDTATFTVYRPAACTNGDLVVNYALSGTATNGTDYAISSASSVTLSANQTTGTVTVTPVWESGGDKTVILTLLATGSYPVGTPNAATCTLTSAAATTCRWTGGASSTDWNAQGNWNPWVPRDVDSVVITNTTAKPSIPAGTYTYNSLSISNGATVTCLGDTSTTYGTGVVLNISGDAVIAGTLTADGKGFAYQAGPGKGVSSTSANGNGGGGASHGGRGGHSGNNILGGLILYDTASGPTSLGSGGGNDDYGSAGYGGAGGGAVKLMAASGTVTINGTLSANGNNGIGVANYGAGGGGGGGSVWIVCDKLDGGGLLAAKGGTGVSGFTAGGGGAGGRMALSYTTSTFTGTVSVASGTGGAAGDRPAGQAGYPGTLSQPGGGDFVVKESLALPAGAYTFSSVTVKTNAILSCQGNTSTTSGVIITAVTITVDTGGSISASGQGYAGDAGPGKGLDSYGGGGGGGAHGGTGGNSGGGAAGGTTLYGVSNAPVTIGSGGGCDTYYGNGCGGYGGGAVKLVVSGTLTANGTIIADGEYGINLTGSGGGAGGSVWLDANRLTGNGQIRAAGGAGGPTHAGGGGGGGRVALYYGRKTFSFATNVVGGVAGSGGGGIAGSAGTWYEFQKPASGTTILFR